MMELFILTKSKLLFSLLDLFFLLSVFVRICKTHVLHMQLLEKHRKVPGMTSISHVTWGHLIFLQKKCVNQRAKTVLLDEKPFLTRNPIESGNTVDEGTTFVPNAQRSVTSVIWRARELLTNTHFLAKGIKKKGGKKKGKPRGLAS